MTELGRAVNALILKKSGVYGKYAVYIAENGDWVVRQGARQVALLLPDAVELYRAEEAKGLKEEFKRTFRVVEKYVFEF
jgi:hypothetical protein